MDINALRQRVAALAERSQALIAQHDERFWFDFSEYGSSPEEVEPMLDAARNLLSRLQALVDEVPRVQEEAERALADAERQRDAAIEAAEAMHTDVDSLNDDAQAIDNGAMERDTLENTIEELEQRIEQLRAGGEKGLALWQLPRKEKRPMARKKIVDGPDGIMDVDDDDLSYELADLRNQARSMFSSTLSQLRSMAGRMGGRIATTNSGRWEAMVREALDDLEGGVAQALDRIDTGGKSAKGMFDRDGDADSEARRERFMERVNRALDQLEPIEAAVSNVTQVVAAASSALDLQRAQILLREVKPSLDTVIYFLGQVDDGKSEKGYPPYDTMRDRPELVSAFARDGIDRSEAYEMFDEFARRTEAAPTPTTAHKLYA